jgi:hypothetical protein
LGSGLIIGKLSKSRAAKLLFLMARPDPGSDNQEATKPFFSRARPDSDKGNQNDENKSSFQVRKKIIKIIPNTTSKGYLLIGDFLLF